MVGNILLLKGALLISKLVCERELKANFPFMVHRYHLGLGLGWTQGDVLRTLLPKYLNKMRFTNPSNGYLTAIMMRLDSFPLSAITNFQNFFSIPIEGSLSFNLNALIL